MLISLKRVSKKLVVISSGIDFYTIYINIESNEFNIIDHSIEYKSMNSRSKKCTFFISPSRVCTMKK